MLSEFENKLAGFIKANGLFEQAGKILLAVSGGADSIALMYSMQALKADGVLSAELVCAHINHQLRGAEAELDEDFVVAQAEELKLAVTTKRLDVRGFADRSKLSIETAGRKLRIEGLLDVAKGNNCEWIATGHQRNDNAETVIQRLLRGTGFRGLGGIWPVRELASGIRFARPLLCVTRDEIIEYLEQRNLKWRVDHTNYDCTYRRNFIRHRLIPALQQDYSGPIVEQLFDLSQSAGKFYSLICSCADKVRPQLADRSGENLKVDLKSLSAQPQPVKVELVRRSLATIGSGERDVTHLHYEKILQLAEQNISGRKVVLPNGFAVRREYGNLVFATAKKNAPPDERIAKSTKIEVPGRTRFGEFLIEATITDGEKNDAKKFKMDSCLRRNDTASKSNFVEWFDSDKLSLPLKVRFREAGDRFWPLGLAGEKKVGKFLTAARVPQEVRRKTLIVTDSKKIIWVWPTRISEQAKVTTETQKILRLQITDTSLAR